MRWLKGASRTLKFVRHGGQYSETPLTPPWCVPVVLVVVSVLAHVVLVVPVVLVHVVLVAGVDGWRQRAAVPSWWTAHRPLRMATDCSGIGVPEIAMQMMGQRTGGAVDHIWTCDVFKPAQKWLQGLMGERALLADVMERSFGTTSGAFTATDIKGNQHTSGRIAISTSTCADSCARLSPGTALASLGTTKTRRPSGRL